MKVLLIGNGAREHCIAEALVKSGKVALAVFASANNPGIRALAQQYTLGKLTDFAALEQCAREVKPHFVVVGPDDPIALGASDLLEGLGIPTVAPLKKPAQLESSKSFTRNLLEKYGIPGNPNYRVFTDRSGLAEYIKERGDNFVIKADGLMGGKGVKIFGEHLASEHEAIEFAAECIQKFGRVVVEEKLVGQEFSLMSFVDGHTVLDMVPVQDHKRAFDGDTGPNTGGMGSYSDANHSLPFLHPDDLRSAHEISERVVRAVRQETGIPFKGILYGGFMAVADGVRLIEYNVRFGDPEVMNVLPILETDFVDVCLAILNNRLHEIAMKFEKKATVCLYAVPQGYPTQPNAGAQISIRTPLPPNVTLYYASVDQRDTGIFLSTSRAIASVGIGDSLEEARQRASSGLACIQGPIAFRRDIGTAQLIQNRISMMWALRK